jgi:hypothetical protein
MRIRMPLTQSSQKSSSRGFIAWAPFSWLAALLRSVRSNDLLWRGYDIMMKECMPWQFFAGSRLL